MSLFSSIFGCATKGCSKARAAKIAATRENRNVAYSNGIVPTAQNLAAAGQFAIGLGKGGKDVLTGIGAMKGGGGFKGNPYSSDPTRSGIGSAPFPSSTYSPPSTGGGSTGGIGDLLKGDNIIYIVIGAALLMFASKKR